MTLLDKMCDPLDLPQKLGQGGYDFVWKGKDAHVSPVRETPLKASLYDKTNCALILISAASIVWAAKRLSRATDVTKMLQVAETELCFQADPRYYDEDSPYFFTKDGMNVAESVVETIAMNGTNDFQRSPGEHHPLPPIEEVADIICLTRHVLDPKFAPAYKAWLEKLIARLNVIAANPHQSNPNWADLDEAEMDAFTKANMGPPFPLEAANVSKDFDTGKRADLYSAFLRSVDWQSNPYLSSPDKMKALGFVGEPYT